MDPSVILDSVVGNVDSILMYVGMAALLAVFTKNSSKNQILDLVLKFINFAGANTGNAKNDPNKE